MINIYYQLAGLVLTIMITILFASKTKLLFDTDRAFSYLLMNILCALTLDVIAVNAMALYENAMIGKNIAQVLCKLFLISIVSVGYLTMKYTEIAIGREQGTRAFWGHANIIPLFVFAAAALFFDVRVKTLEHTGELYCSGSYTVLAYVVLIVYLALCVIIILRNRRCMERRYFVSAITFALLILGAAILTLCWPALKNVSFTMALGLLSMYLEMENPDSYVEKVSSALNNYAFQRWGEKLLSNHEAVKAFVIWISGLDVIKKKVGVMEYSEMLTELTQQIIKLHIGKVFRLDSGEFVFVVKASEDEDSVYRELKAIVEHVAQKYVVLNADYVKYGLIPSLDGYEDMMTLYQELRFFLTHLQSLSGDVLHIMNEEALNVKNEEDFTMLSLKKAIADEQILVYYQPIYSTARQRFTTAEALIRIKDLNGRFMSPEVFIPIAEQRGYILTLGHAVFESVCRFVREQNLEQRGFDYVEINLSTVQCMQQGLASELVSIMKKYSISPGFINLEITETAAIQSENTLMKNMQRLIQLGVSFSLDDYGSGYSNLDYVIRMPFHLVKLDKLLVWSSFENQKTKVLLETSVEMFRKMHLKIVAEGVETQAQALYLEDIGVDYLQGYFFSKPVPEEAFVQIVANNTRRNLNRI